MNKEIFDHLAMESDITYSQINTYSKDLLVRKEITVLSPLNGNKMRSKLEQKSRNRVIVSTKSLRDLANETKLY